MTMVFFRASSTTTDRMRVVPLILDDDRMLEANGLVFVRVDLSHLTDKDDCKVHNSIAVYAAMVSLLYSF